MVQSDIYELVSLGMRYWFVLMGIIILLRAGRWALKEHRDYRRTIAALPDAGLIGEIVNIETGEAQPLPREGVIGSGRGCDVRLHGLRTRELEFILKEGTGVHIMPCHVRHQALLDGQPVDRRDSWALHGSRISLPGYYLRFRLFAGLDVPAIQHSDAQQMGAQENTQSADAFDMEQLMEIDGMPQGYPYDGFADDAYAPQAEEQPRNLDLTWMYAIPPALEHLEQASESSTEQQQRPRGSIFRRNRRSNRHDPS